MGKFVRFMVLSLLLAGCLTAFMLPPRLKIITGHTAKRMCSEVFLAGRSAAGVSSEDNNFAMLNWAEVTVDSQQKSATSRILGYFPQTAVYRPGLGAALLSDEFPESAIAGQMVFAAPERPFDPDTVDWPMGDRIDSSGIKITANLPLNLAVAGAFDKWLDEPSKRTRAIIIVQDGQIIAERYAEGFSRKTPLLGWSMTKSITNALVGILVQDGRIDIDRAVNLPAWQYDSRGAITLHHLLQMSSGLDWEENYGDLSDVTQMLTMEGDMAGIAAKVPLQHAPGAHFYYSSGTSNIISGLIRSQFDSLEAYWRFPAERLFHKIGMLNATLEADASGTFVGSSYCYATARDWARFGLLYLNDGLWQGERILPEGWVKYSTTPASDSGGDYGAHFWLNRGNAWPDAPKDMYACQGYPFCFSKNVPNC